MSNLYEILGVSQGASFDEIKQAYKRAAKEYHPDLPKNKGVKDAAQKMQEINDAFAILKDANKRYQYDEELKQQKEQAEYTSQKSYRSNNQQYNNQQYNNQQYSNEQYNQSKENINNNTRQNTQSNYYSDADNIENDEKFKNLSHKEQERIRKKIEKQIQQEYQKMYEDYARSLGYKVKHKITLKDVVNIIKIVGIIIVISALLWIIPPSREHMINLYNTNAIINIIVNLIKGIIVAIAKTLKQIFEQKPTL